MSVISVLPELLRNKIAAGEVVERPASVVKELLENSIDALAVNIQVEVEKAGRRLIRISDNGTGMSKDDALLAFERYATSKIKSENDLFNIRTMGFRGEALSSIASVAKVRLSTALAGETGTCLEIEGGEVRDLRDCPMTGTSIEIRDIFYNTPARRKFLKTDSTENYHIINAVTQEAISHFQISFTMRTDGSETLLLSPAKSLRERLAQIFGKEFVDDLIESEKQGGDISAKVFAGNPLNFRNNKTNQYVFINRRPVRDAAVSYAVYKAYENMMPKDKHPVFFVFIDMDPAKVDFNVHPAKREVRFSDKSSIVSFVRIAVVEALRKSGNKQYEESPEATAYRKPYTAFSTGGASPLDYTQIFRPDAWSVAEPQAIPYSDLPSEIEPIYLGDTFIALRCAEGLMLLDYHAAHERINYERLLKQVGLIPHRLLFPRQTGLEAGAYKVIVENLALLNRLGIEIEDFGKGSVIVRSLPGFLSEADIDSLISDAADSLLNKDSLQDDGLSIESVSSAGKAVAARLACHSSIRGKRESPDKTRVAELLKDLSETEYPDSCPHGRPTRIIITLQELKKMFKKI
ncbi:MAG: DNA mismatch repair endonuclease MutL [Nitrospirae bacterium]|nr:MAG: DNA mismatch repair endonuclease MutL [Nitrospirota bacterium]